MILWSSIVGCIGEVYTGYTSILWSSVLSSYDAMKSQIFFGAMSEEEQAIMEDTGFEKGSFLVCYLGVPLITMRLTTTDCTSLVNAKANRI